MSIDIKTIPVITIEQMLQIEKTLTEEFGVPQNTIMENAGRKLAELSRRLLNDKDNGPNIAIVVGNRKYRYGGLVAASELKEFASKITLIDVNREDSMIPEGFTEMINRPNFGYRCGVESWQTDSYELVLDLLMGYDRWEELPSDFVKMIDTLNRSDIPIISLDVPSGLDGTTGKNSKHCIRATATLTLALPKAGLFIPTAKPFVGDLFLADISIPHALYHRLGFSDTPLFQYNDIISLGDSSNIEQSQLFTDHQYFKQGCLWIEKE